jgi:hypothetical protein
MRPSLLCWYDQVGFFEKASASVFDSEQTVASRQPEKSRVNRESKPEHDTVDVTEEELRSIAGGRGVLLNIEIDKRSGPDGNPHYHRPDDKP